MARVSTVQTTKQTKIYHIASTAQQKKYFHVNHVQPVWMCDRQVGIQ